MVTCRDIVQLNLDGVRLCAGHSGLNRPVTWTYIRTTGPEQDPAQRGDLVLSVIDLEEADFAAAEALLEECGRLQASGVIFSVIHNRAELPESLLQKADALQLPLFLSDWKNSFAVLSQSIGNYITSAGTHANIRGDFLYNLLFGYAVSDRYVEKMCTRFDLHFDTPHRVGIIVIDRVYTENMEQDERRYQIYMQTLESALQQLGQDVLYLTFQNKGVILLPDRKSAVQQLEEILERQDAAVLHPDMISCTCILGRAYRNPSDFSRSYQEAKQLIPKIRRFPRAAGRKILSAQLLGIYQFLFDGGSYAEIQEYCTDRLRPLEEYDRANNTALVDTLLEYYMSGCNVSRAAEKLYVHRNTLQYRLNKIEDLLQVRLDDYNELLDLINCTMIKKFLI